MYLSDLLELLVAESYAKIRQRVAVLKKCVAGDPDVGWARLLDTNCTYLR
jgi:hypothetical protein